MGSIIKVEHLSYVYNPGMPNAVTALDDVSFEVEEGDFVGIIGATGSGKSTLITHMNGLNKPTSGKIFIDGRDLWAEPEKIRDFRFLTGLVFQYPEHQLFENDVISDVCFGPMNQGLSREEAEKEAKQALTQVGVKESNFKKSPFELSGGMARRVLIGTAVVEQPQLVIADEPTPGLHMEAALRVLSHFREIADQGAGVLLITHDLELALKTADKIVVFYAGTAVEEADTVDFNREAALRHPYTRALFRAMPEHGFAPEPGIQPYVRDLPEGCPYGPRCPKYKTECRKEVSYVPYQGGLVRCICPGDENEILPGILSGPAGLKGQMTSEQITSEQMASGQRSGEYNAWGKEGVSL